MKNFSMYVFVTLIILGSNMSFAVSTSNGPSAPTKASQPIPSLQKTQNIDTVITEKVQSVISKLPILKNQHVSAASYDQIITLEGSVENKTQEQAAIKAARSVKGVKGVKSQLTIKSKF